VEKTTFTLHITVDMNLFPDSDFVLTEITRRSGCALALALELGKKGIARKPFEQLEPANIKPSFCEQQVEVQCPRVVESRDIPTSVMKKFVFERSFLRARLSFRSQ